MMRVIIVLFGIFFDLATCILVAVGVALLWPGTPFDAIWMLKPDREFLLMPYRLWLGPMFLLFALPAAFASYGMLQRRDWARQLAIAIFAANGAGDIVQMVLSHTIEGAIGVLAVGSLLFLLNHPAVRAQFDAQPIAAS